MKGQIASGVVALLSNLLLINQLRPDTTWAEFPALLTPMVVLTVAINVWRAGAGKGQFKVPEIKRPGKKP